MLLILAAILALFWILSIGVWHVASAGIYILLILAIVAIVLHFVRGARRHSAV